MDLQQEKETQKFDPLQLSQDSSMQSPQEEEQQQQQTGEIGLWAARGILLLVAAIWGTNFGT